MCSYCSEYGKKNKFTVLHTTSLDSGETKTDLVLASHCPMCGGVLPKECGEESSDG